MRWSPILAPALCELPPVHGHNPASLTAYMARRPPPSQRSVNAIHATSGSDCNTECSTNGQWWLPMRIAPDIVSGNEGFKGTHCQQYDCPGRRKCTRISLDTVMKPISSAKFIE
ncbi:hypothetical protein DPMN_003913 [Dreissena polymorpha]|uniref:Uncharacterized protein n=1 Tax=Dreissena polymorpha TaxID=45954 RepID=A0A9D4MQS4_DREPO|nr:hypothetical protein DPMN_003913 [Dreissena polymorpha]